jgi:hypothetical protein
MHITPGVFETAAQRQDVDFAMILEDALRYCERDETLSPAVSHVGRYFRQSVEPIASKPLIGNPWQYDTAATTLQRIVNASIVPVEADPSTPSFVCEGAKTISACGYAEVAFSKVIAQKITEADKRPPGIEDRWSGGDIFTEGDVPIFIRKSDGEPSALSLRDIVVNGIPYPKGSILRVDTYREYQEGSPPQPAPHRLCQVEARKIAKVAFIRLSAWAFSPQERADKTTWDTLFIRRRADMSDAQWSTLTSIPIEEVQLAAQAALKAGRVEPAH